MSWYSGKWSLVSHDSNFRAFFLVPFSPLSWSMEQAYLDLKEFWVSCWTEKKHNILPSLRKQLTFRDATDSFSAKDVWEKMTRHYTDGFWLVEANFTSGTTNQKHYPNVGSDSSTTTTTTTTTLYFTPNIQEIKIYNNSTDNDRGAGCPK